MALPEPATEAPHQPAGLHDLLERIREQRPNLNADLIRRAYEVSQQAHSGQKRVSGEPYFTHPLEVARIVAELHMDEQSVAAALLHDVLEDTAITPDQLELEFGEDVRRLVEGVTKLRLNINPDASARQRAQAETTRAAESLRKMLLAMAQDMRVMVIKLADRLHNMRTLESLAPERRTRIANETLDIYAPLAARLGIWQVKWQLEDLGFKILHPAEFQRISDLVAKSRGQREAEIEEAKNNLRQRLDARGLHHVTITGRPKHLYSIFNKMVKQGVPFEEIYDLLALRVITHETYECYLALGIVHDLWLPMPGLFYDYIASPKPNGYRSLHTKVIGPMRDPIEVQIRTQQMHEVAEYGVAAHWSYKEGDEKGNRDAKLTTLREQLFDWSSDSRTSSDFLRTVSTDLFSEQVFVFTPKGDVLDLPKNSTPIDFAFRVHTQLGMTMVGAKVNGAIVPLSTKLQNGDVVELITRSNASPSLDWLENVASQHARSKIRAYFRRQNKTVNAQRGRDAIEKELRSLGLEVKQYIGEDKLDKLALTIHDCENGQDLLAKVGEGLTSVSSVVNKLRGLVKESKPEEPFQTQRTKEVAPTVLSEGIDNVMLKRAKCCNPIPEDDVVGYITRGRGMMIHRRSCPNANRLREQEPERMIPLQWPSDGKAYAVTLSIISLNRQGLLMEISTIFGESRTNVVSAVVRTLPNHTAEIDVTVDVRDVRHLQALMAKIGNLMDVISVLRVFGGSGK